MPERENPMNPNYVINPSGFIRLKDYAAARARGYWKNYYRKGNKMQANKEKKNFSVFPEFEANFVISLDLYENEPHIDLSLNNMEQKLNRLSITPEETAHGQLLFILQAKGLNPMRWGPALKTLHDDTKYFLYEYDASSPDISPKLLRQMSEVLAGMNFNTDTEVANFLAANLDCFFYKAAYCTLDGPWDFNPAHRVIWNPTLCSFDEFKRSIPENKELFLTYTDQRVASVEESANYILTLLEKSPKIPWKS